ncbi:MULTISPECIES: lytic transglycosylase domain-containing protein [Actinomycetes]|uniref:lytic transglycosylase domain-containing protein n=1 Tax=Streptomyces sp. AA4 TaxID=591158 RepID=UPI0001B5408D|nr:MULTISPECIES: hypothetical protein [Actinomycetes]
MRWRAATALAGGLIATLPLVTASELGAPVVLAQGPAGQGSPMLGPERADPPVGVDGSLPKPPGLPPLRAPSGSSAEPGPLGIPASMLKAYRNAADLMAKERPGCRLDWTLLASIGRIESSHARGGYVDAKGNTVERILGPALDGTGGFAAIPASDGGAFTGDRVWDHAVGPMQFITGTWRQYASDGNGDGVSDPNNVYDETLAAGRYLCSGNLDLSSDEGQRTAVRRYNNSDSYVDTVLTWAARYRGGVAQLPDSKAPVGPPPGKPAEAPPAAVPPLSTGTPTPPSRTEGKPAAPAPTELPASSSPSPTAPSTTTTPSTATAPPASTTTTPPAPSTSTPVCRPPESDTAGPESKTEKDTGVTETNPADADREHCVGVPGEDTGRTPDDSKNCAHSRRSAQEVPHEECVARPVAPGAPR